MALADIITSLRILIGDGPDSKVVLGEQLGSDPRCPVDGSNKNFMLGWQAKTTPIVATSVYVTIVGTGAQFRLQTGFTVSDATNGIIAFASAPNPGTGQGQGVYVDYNYQWFTDAKLTEFLNEAAAQTNSGTTDPTTVVDGLKEAMLQYALSHSLMARAAMYAERYATSGGEAGQSVEAVSKALKSLSDAAIKRADTLRDDFYKRQGRREAPAVATTNYRVDPITPFR